MIAAEEEAELDRLFADGDVAAAPITPSQIVTPTFTYDNTPSTLTGALTTPTSTTTSEVDPSAEPDRLSTKLDVIPKAAHAPVPTPTAPPAHDPRASMRALIEQSKRWAAAATAGSSPCARTTSATTRKTRVAPAVALPAWRCMNPAQKFRAAVRAAAGHDGLALTLNLSPAREKALLASDNPLRLFSGYLNRYLATAGLSGLPYALAVEVAPGGKVHLHGAVIAEDAQPDALKRALMRAVGEIAGRAKARQLLLKPISDADGWVNYCLQDQRHTAKHIKGDRLTFVSNDLVRLAKPISTSPARSRAGTTAKVATTTARAVPNANPPQQPLHGPVSPMATFRHPDTARLATHPTRAAPRVLDRQRSRAAGLQASRCTFPASPPRLPTP